VGRERGEASECDDHCHSIVTPRLLIPLMVTWLTDIPNLAVVLVSEQGVEEMWSDVQESVKVVRS